MNLILGHQVMRDRTKETAEAIDQTRLDMAGVEGVIDMGAALG